MSAHEVFNSARRFANEFSGFIKAAELYENIDAKLAAVKGAEARVAAALAEAERIETANRAKLAAADAEAQAKLQKAEAAAEQVAAMSLKRQQDAAADVERRVAAAERIAAQAASALKRVS
jgi:hypothetical protein